MLEIKTILIDPVDSAKFDEQVNEALAEGWVLVRRDLLLKPNALYAELEREVEPEEEESEDEGIAGWRVSRNPLRPYKCTACGAECDTPHKVCPGCYRKMIAREARE